MAKKVATDYKTLYVMGCFGAPMTQKNKERWIDGYAFNRREDREEKIRAASADTFGFDCICFVKGLLWGWNGDADQVYGGAAYKSGGVPDIGADQMLAVCTDVSTDFSKIEIGESALVMGLGILGVFAVQQLRAAGAYPVIAVDPVADRREFALKMGADYALDPTEEGFTEKVMALSDGGVNVCIEVTGLGIGLVQALECMKEMGRVALLGCTRNSKFEIDYYKNVHGKGISLIGAHTRARPVEESAPGLWIHEDDMRAAMNLIRGGRLNFKDMICEIHSPTEAGVVYDRLVNDKKFPIGVIFDWRNI